MTNLNHFLTGMDSDMLLQMTQLFKSFLTEVTDMFAYPRMHQAVLRQLLFALEALGAGRTDVTTLRVDGGGGLHVVTWTEGRGMGGHTEVMVWQGQATQI